MWITGVQVSNYFILFQLLLLSAAFTTNKPAFFLNQLLIAAQLVRVKRFAAEKNRKIRKCKGVLGKTRTLQLAQAVYF